MNPFEENKDDTFIKKPFNIDIWIEVNGRKKNTYVKGWNSSLELLKTHLKNIKKKNGCNGSIKEVMDDSKKSDIILQFQGDHIDFIVNYLDEQGIDKEFINIKG